MTASTGPREADDVRSLDAGRPAPHGRASDSKLFLIALRTGRLSNRLFLFANFIALAEEQGHRIINVAFHSYADLFQSTRRDIYCRYPVAKRRSWLDVMPAAGNFVRKTRLFYHLVRAGAVLNERYSRAGGRVVTLREPAGAEIARLDGPEVQSRIGRARIVFAYGWKFRAPACVKKHAGKIRAYFRPVAESEQIGLRAVEPLRRQAEVILGVHIRRGDYRVWKDGKHFYPVSRYAAWMREFQEQFPSRKTAFLVCSDEPMDPAQFPGLTVGFGTTSPVADQLALAQCDYLIGPPSTFSQWASFYGNRPCLQLFTEEDRIELGRFGVSHLEDVP